MYEMKYLTDQDMPYFRRLAEEGKAVIIELSDQALIHVEPGHFRMSSGEINRISQETALEKQEPALMEKCENGQRLAQEIEEMEKLLEGSESVSMDMKPASNGANMTEEQMKKMIEKLIWNCLHELSSERK